MPKTCRGLANSHEWQVVAASSWPTASSVMGTSLCLNHGEQAWLGFSCCSVLPPGEKCCWPEVVLGTQREGGRMLWHVAGKRRWHGHVAQLVNIQALLKRSGNKVMQGPGQGNPQPICVVRFCFFFLHSCQCWLWEAAGCNILEDIIPLASQRLFIFKLYLFQRRGRRTSCLDVWYSSVSTISDSPAWDLSNVACFFL